MFDRGRMTGFADEAAPGLAGQIQAHEALGWNSIELRNLDGVNICEMDEPSYLRARDLLREKGMTASCLGSAIANWARPISTPFEKDVDDLRRSIPRMRELGTKLIRIMSYPNAGLDQESWKQEVLRRLTELVRIAQGEGMVLALENCDGWAVEKPDNMTRLFEEIPSPSLGIIFDMGNPISHLGTKADTWEFYRVCLPHIVHVHIKDCKLVEGKPIHQFPGQGDSEVAAIVKDLLARGYSGLFSIEPHMKAGELAEATGVALADTYNMYVKYGKLAEDLLDSCS
ncbi:sugar phosphate isomerase/epimerase family protein [uncultured Sphaerochaeta sp.]|uniref:sugar phosphate isomerase/epimerase family protein n=1 Tax=uncultured Sphaerochaeta sp. TaxID=886478 RepID=UPI002A0A710B|nr:sugar phosphate isomerase/epimerase family protein [uncultured Sphaerochaeta sp.]